MIKTHRILAGTLAGCVWPKGRPTPQLTPASIDSVRAVQLRFTFASGDSANVIQVEGGAITGRCGPGWCDCAAP